MALLAPVVVRAQVGAPAIVTQLAQRGQTDPSIARRAARHVLLGLPSQAARGNSKDHLMVRNESVVSYNSETNELNWASWNLRKSDLGDPTLRSGPFRADPSLPKGWYQPTKRDFQAAGFGIGHMVRSGERTASRRANRKTFVFSNAVPQARNNNAGPWLHLENYYRDAVVSGGEAEVIAGPIFDGKRVGRVAVPSHTWKIVVLLKPGQKLADIDQRTRVISVIVPNNNREVSLRDSFASYRVPVGEIERRTGLRFFATLPPGVARALKSRIDRMPIPAPAVPPWELESMAKQRARETLLARGVAGTVKWFNHEKGYGFITLGDGEDAFVHVSELRGLERLAQGQRVHLDLARGKKGLRARDVTMIKG